MAAEDAFGSEQKELVHSLRAERTFLGHSRAMGTFSIMQLCNSFANDTMSLLLVFYLYASVAKGGLGLSQADAAQLISLHSAISILSSLVGSCAADRILGPRRGLRFARCFMAAASMVARKAFSTQMMTVWSLVGSTYAGSVRAQRTRRLCAAGYPARMRSPRAAATARR